MGPRAFGFSAGPWTVRLAADFYRSVEKGNWVKMCRERLRAAVNPTSVPAPSLSYISRAVGGDAGHISAL